MISLALLRKNNISASYHKRLLYNVSYLYENVINGVKPYSCIENVEKLLRDWEGLSESKSDAFNMCIPLLEMVYLTENKDIIDRVTKHVASNILPKVPDAEKVKQRLHKRIHKVKEIIHHKDEEKHHVDESCIDNSIKKLDEVLDELTWYDHVISNHATINKRFNINKLLKESIFTKDDVEDTILEFCKLIDTYELDGRSKIQLALNNCIYALEANRLPYDKYNVVNTISDYFCMTHSEDVDLSEAFSDYLSNSKFYDYNDYKELDILQEYTSFPTLSSILIEDDESGVALLKKDIQGVKDKTKDTAKTLKSTFTGRNIKAYIKSFKLKPKKKPKDIKYILEKLFGESEETVVHEMPNIFRMILAFFIIVPAVAISVIAGIIALIAFLAITHHFSCSSTDRLINEYESHINSVNRKIKKAKTPEQKKRLEDYKAELEKGLKKLKEYRDDLRSEREKDDLEKDNDSDDIDFTESAEKLSDDLIIMYHGMYYLAHHNFVKNPYKLLKEKFNAISGEDIALISELSVNNSSIIDPNIMLLLVKDQREDVLKEGSMSKYIRSSMLKDNMEYLVSNSDKPKIVNENETMEEAFKELSDTILNVDALHESLIYIEPSEKPILEMGITNTINMAIERVKKAASNLSDKERVASRTFDSSLEQMKKGVEDALTIENREAVIRGDILPPMSRCIKLAILFAGAAFLLHPAIAIIGAVATFALNKKLIDKEKQIVLDELDVEITMCNKYITQAEEKKDMKGLKNLLMIKKKLEHERRRLRFNIIRGGKDSNNVVITKDRDED